MSERLRSVFLTSFLLLRWVSSCLQYHVTEGSKGMGSHCRDAWWWWWLFGEGPGEGGGV